jgi:D-sedoheptulose 7-phosphate isomerase
MKFDFSIKSPREFFGEYHKVLFDAVSSVNEDDLIGFSNLLKSTKANAQKVIIVGNGGSAAMASHVSVDLTKAAGIRAVNFNEADLITCFGNDYGYENWVTEALRAYADDGDVLVLISSSGQSPNIVKAAEFARSWGCEVVTFTGFSSSNPLKNHGIYNFYVNSDKYNIVEMTHHTWLVAAVDFIIEDL